MPITKGDDRKRRWHVPAVATRRLQPEHASSAGIVVSGFLFQELLIACNDVFFLWFIESNGFVVWLAVVEDTSHVHGQLVLLLVQRTLRRRLEQHTRKKHSSSSSSFVVVLTIN
jgi:hypothetical protein